MRAKTLKRLLMLFDESERESDANKPVCSEIFDKNSHVRVCYSV